MALNPVFSKLPSLPRVASRGPHGQEDASGSNYPENSVQLSGGKTEWKPAGKPVFAPTQAVEPTRANAGHTKSMFAGLALALSVALCSGCASTGALHGAVNDSLHPQQTTSQQAPKGSQAYQAGKEIHKAVKPALNKGKEIGLEIGAQGKKAGLEIKDQAVEFGHGVRDFFKGIAGK